MHAAIIGDTNTLQLLIKAGADMNGLIIHTDWRHLWDPAKRHGETALMMTAEMGFEDCMTLLLKAGADVNITGQCGHTALHMAVRRNNVKCVAKLLQEGADVNLLNYYGQSALFYAVRNGYHECVNVLIKSGADLNIQDKNGFTPLMVASSLCDKAVPVSARLKCLEFILQAGASVNIISTTINKNALNFLLLDELELVTVETVMLLLAAGETVCALPQHLKQCEMSLKRKCRETIRKHLLSLIR